MSDSHNGQSQIRCAQSKPKGKATGERIPGFKYQLIVEAAGREEPVARIARQVGVDRATATAIIQRESRTIQQRKQELLDQSLRIARRALTPPSAPSRIRRPSSPSSQSLALQSTKQISCPRRIPLPASNSTFTSISNATMSQAISIGSSLHSKRKSEHCLLQLTQVSREMEKSQQMVLLPRSQTRGQTLSNENHP